MAWNHSDLKQAKPVRDVPEKKLSVLYGGVACVVIVGLCIGGWLMFKPEEKKPEVVEKEKSTGMLAEVKPSLSSNVVEQVEAKEVKPAEPVETDPAKIRVKTLSFVTNNMGNIVERYQTADGKTHKLIRPSRPPIFHHATDDLISMALAQGSGGSMPPLPMSGNMDEQFLQSLVEPIVIEDTDSDEIKERKRIVRDARLEIKKLMDEGMHFTEIMAEHEKLFNENAEVRANAIAEAQMIRDEGDTEGTAKYVETMNAAFETMGIEKIEMPKTKEERQAEAQARREARAAAKKNKESQK